MDIGFFDWNGTLPDDMSIQEEAMRATFTAFDTEPPTLVEFFEMFEGSGGDYVGPYRMSGITAPRADLNSVYIPAYEDAYKNALDKQKIALFPGVTETLIELDGRGTVLALVTAQHENLTAPLLKHFKFQHVFKYIAFHSFQKSTVIRSILEETGVDPNKCFMVGDTPSDIHHGNDAGVQTVAFLSGHLPKEIFERAQPDHYITSIPELLDLS